MQVDQLEATAMDRARGDGSSHQAGAVEARERADSGMFGEVIALAWASWVREGRRQGVSH